MNDVRQAFEEWCSHDLKRNEAGYNNDITRYEWYAWNAACHWMRERELEDVERLVKERLELKK
jgi:hypothetical protein